MHIYSGGLLCGSIDGYVFTTLVYSVSIFTTFYVANADIPSLNIEVVIMTWPTILMHD